MKTTKRVFTNGALTAATCAMLLAGCGKQNDTISQAEKTEKDRPSIAETKAIAEEGFIYGLPLVMTVAWRAAGTRTRASPSPSLT